MCFGSSDAPGLIRRTFQNVKVVLCLRDPAKRVFSAYLHMHKKTPCADKRAFEEVLRSMETESADCDLLAAEDKLVAQAIEKGDILRDPYPANFFRKYYDAPYDTSLEDQHYTFRYFQESCFSERIGTYLDAFRERLQDRLLEELVSNPAKVLGELLVHLGLEPEEAVLRRHHGNKTVVPVNGIRGHCLIFRGTGGASASDKYLEEAWAKITRATCQEVVLLHIPSKTVGDGLWPMPQAAGQRIRFWFEKHPELEQMWCYRPQLQH